jgi:hypothetical protein
VKVCLTIRVGGMTMKIHNRIEAGAHQIYFVAGGVYCGWTRSKPHCAVDSMNMRGRGNRMADSW